MLLEERRVPFKQLSEMASTLKRAPLTQQELSTGLFITIKYWIQVSWV